MTEIRRNEIITELAESLQDREYDRFIKCFEENAVLEIPFMADGGVVHKGLPEIKKHFENVAADSMTNLIRIEEIMAKTYHNEEEADQYRRNLPHSFCSSHYPLWRNGDSSLQRHSQHDLHRKKSRSTEPTAGFLEREVNGFFCLPPLKEDRGGWLNHWVILFTEQFDFCFGKLLIVAQF